MTDWITWLEHRAFPGMIGMSRFPGLRDRSLEEELALIRQSGATTLVTLNDARELRRADASDLGEEAEYAGLVWHHLPIRDFGVPGLAFEAKWREVGPDLRARLRAGERIVIHCYAGLGRTGLLAARLLIELGEPPERAIRLVREVRPRAIQTIEQEAYLLDLRPDDPN